MKTILHHNQWVIIALLVAPFFAIGQNGSTIYSPAGVWLSENGNEKIEIYEKDGKFNGIMVWMKDEYDENGNLKVDSKNPDEALRERPMVGVEILFGFKYTGNGWYTGGRIYDPGTGNTYAARIKMVDETTAKIRGYVGIPLFGRSEVCTKVIE
ncbi:MAG: DUF2147 domain-containing protein [Bacteroidota bacterium]